MLLALSLAGLALQSGLRLRRLRRGGAAARADRARHLRLAKPAVALVLVGFAGGPLSMAFLRGREPFDTAHALAGTTAALLFAATALLGRRLERGRSRPHEAHALLAALATLAAGAAAITGFVLLP